MICFCFLLLVTGHKGKASNNYILDKRLSLRFPLCVCMYGFMYVWDAHPTPSGFRAVSFVFPQEAQLNWDSHIVLMN